jgi:hypothetical protein
MGEYRPSSARGTGLITTPAGMIRNDPGGDLAGANLELSEHQSDSAGALRVTHEGGKLTYSCAITGLVPVASCTDLVIVNGSATKTVKITRIEISILATAAASVDIQLVRRSTANLTGTSTTPAVAPNDSGDAAATAVVKAYTANPGTLGTLTGVIRTRKYLCNAPAAAEDFAIWQFGDRAGAKELVLRGVADGVAINLNAGTVGSGGTADISIEFTEEPLTA